VLGVLAVDLVAVAVHAPAAPAAAPARTAPVVQVVAAAPAAAAATPSSTSPPAPSPPAAVRGPVADYHPGAVPTWAQAPVSSTELVPLPGAHRIRVYDAPRGAVLIDLANPLLVGVPLVLSADGPDVGGWIAARLPVRPNNVIGYVKDTDVRAVPLDWSVDVYQAEHEVLVWQGSTLRATLPSAVGKPATRTPTGRFYVLARLPGGPAYGPIILATSGFSEVYTTFGDGDADIALHGTDEDASVGHSASHGCMRLHNSDAAWLGHRAVEGTSVRIMA